MITATDIRFQVTTAIESGDGAETIDIDGIVTEIVATHGLVDIDTIESDAFWAIVAKHDSTQADVPSVDLVTAERAEWLVDMPQLRGNGHRLILVGTAVELTADALEILADLPEDNDGHFDGGAIYIGGTAYPVRTA